MNTTFQLSVTRRNQVAVVGEVEERDPRACLLLSGQIRKQVVAVEMHLERLAGGLVSVEQLLLDIGLAGG